MDKIDVEILEALKKNGKQSHREIGEALYISSQAVSQRVQKLRDQNIIDKYTIDINLSEHHFVTIYMERNTFSTFESYLQQNSNIIGAHKVIGEGCYQVIFCGESKEAFTEFLKKVETFGTYKTLTSIKKIK